MASEAESLTKKIMTAGDQEEIAREASALIKEKQILSLKLRNFQQRSGAAPEDIVLTYGMEKLSNKIVSLQ